MSELSLAILQPAHNSFFNDKNSPVQFQGELSGDGSGLFFKWFSSLNSAATIPHPELNKTNHSATILNNWDYDLQEFGSHIITLAAVDQDPLDLASIKAISRGAMTGGAPPEATAPCVIHRLKAQIRTPVADGQNLSRANCTLEVLAPVQLAKKDPPKTGPWVRDNDYLQVNVFAMKVRLVPDDPVNLANALTIEIPLDLSTTPFIRADDQTWLQWRDALPDGAQNGNYVLSLIVSAGGKTATAERNVVLTD